MHSDDEDEEEDGGSFEICMTITTDIVEILEDLNKKNASVIRRIENNADGQFDTESREKMKKKRTIKRTRRRKVWSGDHTKFMKS